MVWAVVHSHPMAERKALSHLERQGFTCYAPREKITYIVRSRKVSGSRWLFPRYLFVTVQDHWQRWFNTIGVSTVIMNGLVPAKLPDGWIENMKAQEHHGLINLKKSRFKRGQHVQVTGGFLSGYRGIYQGQSSRQREIVLLEALGRVELSPDHLREINAGEPVAS